MSNTSRGTLSATGFAVSDVVYRRVSGDEVPKEPGPVIAWDDAVLFCCPCGEHPVYLKFPPRIIMFDEDGKLSLDGSIGMRADESHPPNWCHFFIRDGRVEMCGDAACPGGKK